MGFDYRLFPAKLNVGCGFDIRKGYLNVDFNDFHKPDLIADVQNLEMLPSGYYKEIIAQDVLEHLPRNETKPALLEWNRLLAPKGILKLRVPNVIGVVNLLQKEENQNIKSQRNLIQCLFGTQAYTGDFHYTGFTEMLLKFCLEITGFTVIEIMPKDIWLFDVTAEKGIKKIDQELGVSGLDDRTFISQAYRTILEREPDAEGFDFYLSKLKSGEMDRAAISTLLHDSDERLRNVNKK